MNTRRTTARASLLAALLTAHRAHAQDASALTAPSVTDADTAINADSSALNTNTGMDASATAVTDTDASVVKALDAGVLNTLVIADAGAGTAADANTSASSSAESCVDDPVPSGHEFRATVRVEPADPKVGDLVKIIYRFEIARGDVVQFAPNPMHYLQEKIELEPAEEQPTADLSLHEMGNGRVYGETRVHVLPFTTGEVSVDPQLARLTTPTDVLHVCMPRVQFRVKDPFGNEPHPTPKDITQPENATIDWLGWRWFALALDGVFLAAVATLAVSKYVQSRPKYVPPPPPPRPAWEVALEALEALSNGDLLSRGLAKDYYDTISDVLRRYLGATCGFDALEMTTDQVVQQMRVRSLPAVAPAEIEALLRECDLVKFARYMPEHEQADMILTQAIAIVNRSSQHARGGSKASSAESSDKKRAAS